MSTSKPVTFVALSLPASALSTNEDGAPVGPAAFLPPEEAGSVHPFEFPPFKPGQMDGLLQQAEDFGKLAASARTVLDRASSSMLSLDEDYPAAQAAQKKQNSEDSRRVLKRFEWDRIKYHPNLRLEDFVETFREEVSFLDVDIKNTFSEYNQAKSALQKLQQSRSGNLSTRSLASVITPEHTLFQDLKDSEFMEPQLVAVPNDEAKKFRQTYSSLTECVVPGSLSEIQSDKEYTLFAVVVVKDDNSINEFLMAVRSHKWIPRVYKPAEFSSGEEENKLAELERNVESLLESSREFGKKAYEQGLMLWLHLTVLTMYVETVLRYGLPLDALSWFVEVNPRTIKPFKRKLDQKFGHLGGDGVTRDSKGRIVQNEAEVSVPGLTVEHDFTPYVYYKLEFPGTEAS